MPSPLIATWIILAAVAVNLALRLWLSARQIRFVSGHAGTVPPAFAAAIRPEEHARAARYTIAKQQFAVVEMLGEGLLFALLTWGGGIRLVRNALDVRFGTGFVGELALLAAIFALLAVADLPLAWFRQFHLEQRFGFNRMTPATFALDALKTALLAVALGLPLAAVVLACMRSAGPWWWLAAWAVWTAFTFALTAAYPRWIAPLFNRFTPLADGPLRERIAALLARTGFRSNGVYTMDGSRRSSHGNAYFAGLGGARRIVFYDTLVERLQPDEVEAVLAHELGHFRLHHVRKRMISGMGSSLFALALLGWLSRQDWFYVALGVPVAPRTPRDGLALVLFALAVPWFALFLAPLRSAYSRRHEFEADAFAAQNASAAALVRALVRLYQDNAATLTPDPLHSLFYDSHPPAAARIGRLASRGTAT